MSRPSLRAEAHAWYAPTSDLQAPGAIDAALGWLTSSERQRYDRYRADEDRHMFLLGRTMARAIVGRCLAVPPTSWQWREGTHGRPEIAEPPTDLTFNLAHSAGLVVCAVAWGREVGVDVEDLKRPPVEWNVVTRYCAPREVSEIGAHQAWHDRFLYYWTLKEAYLKARGVGISVPLAQISFELGTNAECPRIEFTGSLAGSDTRWTFRLDQPTDRHLLAVAAATGDDTETRIHVERLLDFLPAPDSRHAP
jgi:4'-phosphopantetheinyl transferase